VESEPGQGTAFKFTLPLDHEARVLEADQPSKVTIEKSYQEV